MSYGTTIIACEECTKEHIFYGWLPTALLIWHQDEGLECCGVQTIIVSQEGNEE